MSYETTTHTCSECGLVHLPRADESQPQTGDN